MGWYNRSAEREARDVARWPSRGGRAGCSGRGVRADRRAGCGAQATACTSVQRKQPTSWSFTSPADCIRA